MAGGTSGQLIFITTAPKGGCLSASGKHRLIRGGGLVARISDEYEPQFPVVGEDLPCPAARDVVASRVGAVWPLDFIDQRNRVVGNSSRLLSSDSDDSDDDVLLVGAVPPLMTATPLGGTEMIDDCRLQADSLDDVLSEGASENRHGMCYDLDIIVPGRELGVDIPDVDRDICVLPDEFPVVVDGTAVELLSLPVVVQTRPQVVCDPDLDLSKRYVVVDIVDTRRTSVICRVWFRKCFQECR